MKDRTRRPNEASNNQFGVPIESALARRERLANRYDYDFGQERVFPELVEALLEEVPRRQPRPRGGCRDGAADAAAAAGASP